VAIEVGRSVKLPFQSHQTSLTRFGASEPRFQLGLGGPVPTTAGEVAFRRPPHRRVNPSGAARHCCDQGYAPTRRA
jgi:hypothetical protein